MNNTPSQPTDEDEALSDEQLDLVVGGASTGAVLRSTAREDTAKLGQTIGRENVYKAPAFPGSKINQP